MENNPRIKDEPAIRNLLSRMPSSVAESFTDDQLMHLKVALGARNWGKHKIDLRGTFPFPFRRTNIYYVFLMGKNHRELSRREKAISNFTFAVFVGVFFFASAMLGILVLYLIKSALGIDLIEGFSFGVWGWFKDLWD